MANLIENWEISNPSGFNWQGTLLFLGLTSLLLVIQGKEKKVSFTISHVRLLKFLKKKSPGKKIPFPSPHQLVNPVKSNLSLHWLILGRVSYISRTQYGCDIPFTLSSFNTKRLLKIYHSWVGSRKCQPIPPTTFFLKINK